MHKRCRNKDFDVDVAGIFKLEEIQAKRTSFLKPNQIVVDLGVAPGWTGKIMLLALAGGAWRGLLLCESFVLIWIHHLALEFLQGDFREEIVLQA